MNSLVSIIIPCYNSAKFIEETINSVVHQTYSNWECIIVDNGSKDNSAEVVERAIKNESKFQLFKIEQSGVSNARNYAISKSKGKYILPLDSDDLIDKSYIEKAVQVLEKSPDVKLVYSDAVYFGAIQKDWILPEYSFKNLLILNGIFSSAVFRKSDFDKTNGYNLSMKEGLEDWDFWISFLNEGDKVYKIPEKLFHYRIRTESRNNSLDLELRKKLRRQIFENHKEKFAKCFLNADFIHEHYLLLNELEQIRNSKTYKLGKLLLSPLSVFKK